MNSTTCCFTGHRRLPADKVKSIAKRLEDEIDRLYFQGVTDFISGGAIGFDQVAASVVIDRRDMGLNIRLIFALPCRNQDEHWTSEQKRLYQNLLQKADELIYVSQDYTPDCMKKRNYYMIDNSAYCICALLYDRSGTGQTVRYAQSRGVEIVNVAR